MNSPLVSVITPVYNGSLYLDHAVRSVKAQTFEDWELLLIDDGSADGSFEKMEKWAETDSRIKVLHHPGHVNKGVSSTRNLGIQHARGKYVALLDCDDEWLPDKMEKQVQILEEYPDIVLTYCKAVTIDREGIELDKSAHDINFPKICGSGIAGKTGNVVDLMIRDTLWMPCLTVTIRADVLKKTGGFDETLSYQVDDHLLFTLIANEGPVYFIDKVLAKYRIHPTSYTCTTDWLYSMVEYYDRLYSSLPEKYFTVISSSYSQTVAMKLVSLSSFMSSGSFRRMCQSIFGLLADKRVLLIHKIQFSFMALENIVRQAVSVIWQKINRGMLFNGRRI